MVDLVHDDRATARASLERNMKPSPPGWPRISSAVYYDDAAAAIDWLCRAFGFEVQLKIEGEGGRIEHSELVFGGGLVMVGQVQGKSDRFPYRRSPSQVDGANTQNMMVYVDDVEVHCRQARVAGATIVSEPKTVDYGEAYWSDRGYQCRDIGGHHWWFYERIRTGKPKE
jgi:uncharacterized glyoxalase superfamily protein PhnB